MTKKKFVVECTETRFFTWTLEVEADSEEEARDEVYLMYESGDLHGNGPDVDESENGLDIISVEELEVVDSSVE